MKCQYALISILVATLLVACGPGESVVSSVPTSAEANPTPGATVTNQPKDKRFTVSLSDIDVRQVSTGQSISVESLDVVNQTIVYSVAH